MKKVISIVLSSVLLLLAFTGCEEKQTQLETVIETPNFEMREDLVSSTFSTQPFFDVTEEETLDEAQLMSEISNIPRDQYEAYPKTHYIPLSATLCKNGETIELDLSDPRLIALINTYNNCVYHNKFSYLQGLFDIENLNEYMNEEFKLVITFNDKQDGPDTHHDRSALYYETLIVTNKDFVLIDYDNPGYDPVNYPVKATGHWPLYRRYGWLNWLDLFGF